jgi:hypothetical protein
LAKVPSNSSRRGSDYLLLESYYKTLPSTAGWAKQPGQLYYAHSAYPPEYPEILKPERIEPRDATKSRFYLKPFSDGDEHHIPSKELGLEDDELYYVYTGKRRLVAVLGCCEQTWYREERKQIILLCAPVFSFKPRHSQEFILRAQAFDFPNLFYLPPGNDGCTDESAARFEYIQPIAASCLNPALGLLSRQPISLSEQARDLMLVHLSRFLGLGEADRVAAILGDIKAYHDLIVEQLP